MSLHCFGEALKDAAEDFCGFDVDYSLPRRIGYDLELLKQFCGLDPDCVLIFYGGEPLLCLEEIKHVIDARFEKD